MTLLIISEAAEIPAFIEIPVKLIPVPPLLVQAEAPQLYAEPPI